MFLSVWLRNFENPSTNSFFRKISLKRNQIKWKLNFVIFFNGDATFLFRRKLESSKVRELFQILCEVGAGRAGRGEKTPLYMVLLRFWNRQFQEYSILNYFVDEIKDVASV